MKKTIKEDKMSDFYNNLGWHKTEKTNIFLDSLLWEDNRKVADKYVSKCRLRIIDFIESNKNTSLDVGCGPIQYKEYFKYYEKFKFNHFLDISKSAIDKAKLVARPGSKFYCQSASTFQNKNYYDFILCNHALYHMDKSIQKKVVLNLIYSLNKNGKIIITYTNKFSVWNFIFLIPQIIYDIFKNKKRKIYHYSYKQNWWYSLSDVAKIKLHPLRSISSRESKMLIPNNKFGAKIFDLLLKLENKFPKFFLYFGTYYIIEIKKNN